MHQNGTDLASVNSFIRQADSKPLATKCMGTNKAGTEHVEKLTGSAGVTVADASVYGEHHHVETVGELADVFQLAQETLFFLGRVNVDAEVGAVDQSP